MYAWRSRLTCLASSSRRGLLRSLTARTKYCRTRVSSHIREDRRIRSAMAACASMEHVTRALAGDGHGAGVAGRWGRPATDGHNRAGAGRQCRGVLRHSAGCAAHLPGEQLAAGWRIGSITKEAEDAQRRALACRRQPDPRRDSRWRSRPTTNSAFPNWQPNGRNTIADGLSSAALTLELPTDADDEVMSWIAAGTPPIYFGFGSSVRLPCPLTRSPMISEACAQLGERALICSGASDFPTSRIPTT